jgi:hypothetical protein
MAVRLLEDASISRAFVASRVGATTKTSIARRCKLQVGTRTGDPDGLAQSDGWIARRSGSMSDTTLHRPRVATRV